jgi:hypothetical protein
MADPTLAELVSLLREKGMAATDDVFNGITYWTDEQLEAILWQSQATKRVKLKGSNRLTYQISLPKGLMLSTDIEFQTSAGGETSGTYTYTPISGRVVFSEEQADTVLYVVGPVFNLNNALADLWDRKAAQRFDYVDFRAGHNTMALSQTPKFCISQRDYYRARTIRSWK